MHSSILLETELVETTENGRIQSSTTSENMTATKTTANRTRTLISKYEGVLLSDFSAII